jgi:hypothetical protein
MHEQLRDSLRALGAGPSETEIAELAAARESVYEWIGHSHEALPPTCEPFFIRPLSLDDDDRK